MNVDTGEFRALAEQVEALSRDVRALWWIGDRWLDALVTERRGEAGKKDLAEGSPRSERPPLRLVRAGN